MGGKGGLITSLKVYISHENKFISKIKMKKVYDGFKIAGKWGFF